MSDEIKLIALSSLDKVFLDQEPVAGFPGGSMLINEKYSFQVAFTLLDIPHNTQLAKLKIDSQLKDFITVRVVGNLPSITPSYPRYDDYYLRTNPGLFPDPLYEIKGNDIKILRNKWQALWFTIQSKDKLPTGKFPIHISLSIQGKNIESTVSIEIEVIDSCLPEQKLIYTNWFHCDCIASMYNTEIFSEEHWLMIESFIKTASQNGMNMILTPAFTPPLDTEIGAERATVQLVDVYKKGSQYTFNFDKLNRWIDVCITNGIKYFEHSHLFTQWGAEFAPKIMALENGELKRQFGWDTPSTGEEYVNFLNQYIPAVLLFLKNKGIDKKTYFHISDEPTFKKLKSYAKAREIVKDYLKGYKIFDALSDYEFYKEGLVTTPIPTTEHINDFIGKVDDLWTYYTGFQCVELSNRLFSMPSARNRILGTQMYKYDIKGFLQWAFNFYYTTLCREECNPLFSTDAYGEFPSGSAFMVYPGVEGPIESLRLLVFNEGLQDMRAMQLLESYIGKEGVMKIVEHNIDAITFTKYPHSDSFLLNMRERINQEIKKYTI